jgi:hypothetical protein
LQFVFPFSRNNDKDSAEQASFVRRGSAPVMAFNRYPEKAGYDQSESETYLNANSSNTEVEFVIN